MAATVRLTVLTGPHQGNRYCFRKAGDTTVGRSSECDVCVCGADRDLHISRRHCRLTFDPPNVLVDDLRSSNGTYVNGLACPPPVFAKDGDILTIGGTSMQISVVDCAECDMGETVLKNCPVEC
jgi:pSer/pThr/pTyr-binding forkhead associated (FHA) protein